MSEITSKLLAADMIGQYVSQGEGVVDCTEDFQCEKCKSTFSTESTLNKHQHQTSYDNATIGYQATIIRNM